MRRWAVAFSFLGQVVFAAIPVAAQNLERAVAAAEALGARTGVAVCDSDGSVLYRHRATEAFAPASNMKVLTAAAVVAGLGADHRFATRFELSSGRLAVIASGDPNWCHDSDHDPAVIFRTVAQNLRRLGVDTIGGIDLRAGTFVGPGRPATWPQDQLQTYYCAPTGAFVLEQGTFHVRIEARGGDHAQVQLTAPAAGLPCRGSIELVDNKRNATYGASDQGDAFVVRGRFPRRGNPVTIRSAVTDPAGWYEAALRHALAENGISIGRASALRDQLVLEHTSELRSAIQRMLEDSSNFDAEQCLRVLGHHRRGDGSLAGGLTALQTQVTQLVGIMPAGVVLADGSGLSKQNRLTPGLVVATLVRAETGAPGAMLRACLPVAGHSGTMADRFRGTDLVGRVRAKTGWIRGASSLSGLVENKHGRVRWFSILMNYDPKKDGLNKDLKQLQEDIVAAIDRLEAAR
jgi:serine-type D-Ala-D-Ala carboxypeptidase/endopeptidase (penicillin-binding protein 4)